MKNCIGIGYSSIHYSKQNTKMKQVHTGPTQLITILVRRAIVIKELASFTSVIIVSNDKKSKSSTCVLANSKDF